MTSLLDAIYLLRPYDIDRAKVRIGPNTDGGYVFVDNLSPDQTVLSYGIGNEYRFEIEMAERGHTVHMYDHTVDPIAPVNANMHFHPEGVAGVSIPEQSLYSIEDHIARHGVEGDRLILKMDVEGAEYAALAALSDETLARFEQIVLEVHEIYRLGQQLDFREDFVALFERINRHFTLCHVHANNCCGRSGIIIIDGFPMYGILELTYVRTSTINRQQSRTVYPTELDYPNIPRKDIMLWMFPFCPTDVPLEDYAVSHRRSEIVAAS